MKRINETIYVDLEYPRCKENATNINISLIDIRAADSLLISYDFNRDGWSIKQQKVFEWASDDLICDPKWSEVAFIQAWGLEENKE